MTSSLPIIRSVLIFLFLMVCQFAYGLGKDVRSCTGENPPRPWYFRDLTIVGEGNVAVDRVDWEDVRGKEIPNNPTVMISATGAWGWTFDSLWALEGGEWVQIDGIHYEPCGDLYCKAIFLPKAYRVAKLEAEGTGIVELVDTQGKSMTLDAQVFNGDTVTVRIQTVPGERFRKVEVEGLEEIGALKYRVIGNVKVKAFFRTEGLYYRGVMGDRNAKVRLVAENGRTLGKGNRLYYHDFVRISVLEKPGWTLPASAIQVEGLSPYRDGYLVEGDVAIRYRCEPVYYTLKMLYSSPHGEISLIRRDGDVLAEGAILRYGEELDISIRPHAQWELALDSLQVKGLRRFAGHFYVTGDVRVYGSFYPQLYKVCRLRAIGAGEVRLTSSAGLPIGVNGSVYHGQWVYLDFLPTSGNQMEKPPTIEGLESMGGDLYRVHGPISVEAYYTANKPQRKRYPLSLSTVGPGRVFVTLSSRDTLYTGDSIPINMPFKVRVKPEKGYAVSEGMVDITGAKLLAKNEFKAIGPVEVRVNFIPEEAVAVASTECKATIAPNPTSDYISVRASEPIESYAVYSLSGELLIRDTACTDSFILDVAGFQCGMYLVRVHTSAGGYMVLPFVRE